MKYFHENARQAGYDGDKLFEVRHPDHAGAAYVAAQDATTAIYEAASLWGRKWTEYKFYAWCSVRRIR